MLLAGGDAWPAPGTWYETRPWLAAWLAGRPRVILAYDVSLFPGRCPRHSIGFEVRPFPVLALRLGYYLVPDTNPSVPTGGMTWGFGFDFKFIRLDFANDDALYFFSQRRFRLSLALNLSEPLLSSGPLLH